MMLGKSWWRWGERKEDEGRVWCPPWLDKATWIQSDKILSLIIIEFLCVLCMCSFGKFGWLASM